MDQENGNDSFHDSEMGDVFCLYNACNGALLDGLLDVRKLDELSAAEAKVLDIARLKQVWQHMASGCAECRAIIATLNSVRERLNALAAEPDLELAQAVNALYADSL